jgi:squalene-hopene/tetraprenyl-beta-curcumene cyclase
MNRPFFSSLVPAKCVGIASLALLAAVTPAAVAGDWSPQAAADYLDGRADWWLRWDAAARGNGTACLSCHTAVPFALGRSALGRRVGESEARGRMVAGVARRVANWDKIVSDGSNGGYAPFYGHDRKRSAVATESVLNALVLVDADVRGGRPLGEAARSALRHVWEQQEETGDWPWLEFGLRPWEKDGRFYGAALAAFAVNAAGATYREEPGVGPKVAALTTYLATHFAGETLHDRAFAAWAAGRLPGAVPDAAAQRLLAELRTAQTPDGGWSLATMGGAGPRAWKPFGVFPPGTTSDGYATAIAVLALRGGGVAADDPALRRGVTWLRANQRDGTWPATYVNKARDPQSDVGKFFRDAATGFAVLALAD